MRIVRSFAETWSAKCVAQPATSARKLLSRNTRSREVVQLRTRKIESFRDDMFTRVSSLEAPKMATA